MADISASEMIELLFKKAVGVPNAKPGSDALQEVPGNVGPRIIPTKQIYSETIPPVAPGHYTTLSTDPLVEVDISAFAFVDVSGIPTSMQVRGKSERGTINPHIYKYTDCKTTYIKKNRSFWFAGTTNSNALTYNIFSDAIPSRFDARYNSYIIELSIGGVPIPADDKQRPWYFDTEAGIITFWDDLTTDETPVVTFWRYKGTKGISSGSGSGATGPTGASGREWIDKYLVNQPPKVEFLTPTITSTEIRIGWKYPDQIQANFFSTLHLPYINNLTNYVNMKKTDGTDVSMNILVKDKTDKYIRSTTNDTPIRGVILTRIDPSGANINANGIITDVSGTVSISGEPVRVIRYYHPNFTMLAGDASSNKLHVFYMGYRTDDPSDNTVGFNIFIQAGPPSAVRDLAVKNPDITALDLSYNEPLEKDVSDNTSSAVISNYYALYDSSGSSVRYPSGVDISGSFRVLNAGLTARVDNLYAEAPYTFRVYAKNNSSGISGELSNDASNNTLPPRSEAVNMLNTALSIPLSSNLYTNGTALLLPTTTGATIGTEIRTQLLRGPADLSLNIAARTIPVDLSGTRGKLGIGGAPLARFEVELSGGSLATAASSSASYGDWDVSAATVVDASGIKLSAANAIEANTTSVYTQGFYRKADISGLLDLSEAKIVPSRTPYSVRAYQRNKDASGDNITAAAALKVTTAPVNFYYDTFINSGPGVGDISASLMSGTTFKPVSGVTIVETPVFDLSYNLTNMGHFVYRSPYTTYTASNSINLTPPTETDLTKIKSGFDVPTGVFTTGNISVRRDDISGGAASGAAKYVDLSATPYNIDSSGNPKSARINMVVDPASIALVKSFPQSVPSVTTSNVTSANAVVGLYIDSSANAPGYAETLPITYDHGISLNQNVSLQISSGKFVTKLITNTIAPIAYQDYSGTYYNNVGQNTANYSGITTVGTRYATFMWNLSAGTNFSKMFLVFTNPTGIGFNGANLQYITIDYRFIETNLFNGNNGNDNNLVDENIYNSIWINGAKSDGIAVAAGNYYVSGNTLCGLENYPTLFTSNNTIQLKLPTSITSKAVRVIMRIGLPMNRDMSFSSVSLYAQA